ncbi:MAG TPA: ATP-binding protein [Clostridia bacterium]|nr:ATP-binding protein [Clostridia bacterium]
MLYFFRNKTVNIAMLLILIPVILIMSLMIMSEPPRPAVVSEDWQYRYGDSPKNEQGVPLWVYDGREGSNWTSFTCPGQPPVRSATGDIWLRTVLPDSEYRLPSIMFTTNDQLFQVYLEDRLIYSYGNMEDRNDRIAPGSPWHLIQLPEDYRGKPLYLRMHATFARNTGFVRRFEIGSENEHIAYLIASEMDNVLLVCLFTFLGFSLILVYALRKSVNYEFPALGFFSISIGLWLLAETNFKQLFFYPPRFWLYVAFLSLYLMPVGFLIFVERVFSPGNIYMKMMSRLHILFTAVTLLLDITRIVPFIYTLQAYYVVLALSIVTIFVTITKASRTRSNDTGIFIWGFSVFTLFGVYDILGMYFRLVPWIQYIIPYGMFMFLLSMIYILGQRIADVYDKLKVYTADIQSKNEALHEAYEEVNESRNKLSEWNKGLEQTIRERTASVRNLLDNAGQGFLTFGSDLAVAGEFSSECLNIFNCDITGRSFPELVYPESSEDRSFLGTLLKKLLTGTDGAQREIFMSLLPEEFSLEARDFHMAYKIIKATEAGASEVIMVILTDITYKRQLESKVEQERNVLKMVVKVITNYDDFSETVKDYRNFCRYRLSALLRSSRPAQEVLYEIYRAIHTFKGTFCLFDMHNIIERLHSFETKLSGLKDRKEPLETDSLVELFRNNDPESWLTYDMNTLQGILGDNFPDKENTISIKKESLLAIEEMLLRSLPPSQCRLILSEIRKLRQKPIKEILKGLPEYAQSLAGRMDKLLNPVEIKAEDIPVDPDRYQDFTRALVHVIRNIIDHGLETQEERFLSGKSEYCNIGCEIRLEGEQLCLTISDDGKGFDFDRLRQAILQRGLLSQELACGMTDSETLDFVIDNHVSTKGNAGYISGRGLGLSSIREETERLGGTMTITAERGKGTRFFFRLPHDTGISRSPLPVSSILEPVMTTAKKLLQQRLACDPEALKSDGPVKAESILLKDFTCFIGIRGLISGRFIFSAERSLAERLLENVIIGELSGADSEMYAEDLLAESTNIIIGNSIKKFPGMEDLIILEPPVSIKITDAALKYINSPAWSYNIETPFGNASVSFVTLRNNGIIMG